MWICHLGDTQTYSNFSTFTQTVLQSQVKVDLAREKEDELVGCLRTENCLGGDLVRTVDCLSAGGPCSLHNLKHSSATAQCLFSQTGAGPDIAQLVQAGLEAANKSVAHLRLVSRYLDCLRSSQTEISVSFSISGSKLNMDWSGELTYQVNHLISHIRYQIRAVSLARAPTLLCSH